MLGGDDDVFHACLFGERDYFFGVELGGVKFLGVRGVNVDGDFGFVQEPLADAGVLFAVVGACRNGVDAPMNEHAEASFAPPLHAGIVLGLRFGAHVAGDIGGFFVRFFVVFLFV